jgi:thioredoxin reductase/uncharacterized Fe-S cluster-containing radical SAM superfamily protein
MNPNVVYDLIIIGAGPVGLEAGLYAAESDLDFLLLEKDQPAAALGDWGFVRMFSPFEMNASPLGCKVLGLESRTDCLTGREMKEQYFDRLAAHDTIAPRIRCGVTVEKISRYGLLKAGLLGKSRRSDYPFFILAQQDGNEIHLQAKAVIDSSGVYGNHNYLGIGGLPARGERERQDQISYHMVDLNSSDSTVRGNRFLVLGSGHSACTMLAQIDTLSRTNSEIEAHWVTSAPDSFPIATFSEDPLPERASIVARANELGEGANERIRHQSGRWVKAIERGGNTELNVTLTDASETEEVITVDHIFAMVGYRPDRSLYEELQVHECYASAGPMKLAASLLATSASGDCLAPIEGSDDLYNNPEPNFFILGAKSFGRSTNFLIQKGHEQIRAVFKQITKKPELDLYGDQWPPIVQAAKPKKKQVAQVGLDSLENLWFQVGGTICNLTCNHCFISCSPENDRFKFMSLDQIQPYLDEAMTMGVREFYFTGGEPFLNEEMYDILEATLKIGPATVLTNGTIIGERRADRLKQISDATNYSLELRVSLDGFDTASNDRIRGEGSFDRAIKGIARLVARGFLPIVTAVQTWPDEEHPEVLENFKKTMEGIGYNRPRLKVMPALDLGVYKKNKLGEPVVDIVTQDMMIAYDESQLICNNTRMVAHDGVYVCPILIESGNARMGQTLSETTGEFALNHPACTTCYFSGAICSNFAAGRSER